MPFMRSESCSFIWHPKVVTLYVFDMARSPVLASSARNARATLTSVVGGPRLPDDGDLDLARVLELLLDLPRDLVGEQDGAVVVERAGRDHDADLAPGLHRVDLVHAVVAGRDLLEVAEALDVLLERLAARAR